MAAEGIMSLGQQGMPQEPAQPPMDQGPQAPVGDQEAAMNAAFQMDPAEFEQGVDEALSEVDPALAQELQQMIASIQLTEEVKQALLDAIQAILEYPQDYQEIRADLLSGGFPESLLPEQLNLEFFATLRYVILRTQATQAYKDGGPVSLKPIAEYLRKQGRNGDTMLAHITPQEARMLKAMGGAGTINPATGLPEYNFLKKAWKAVTKTVKAVVKTIGKAIEAVAKPIINVTKKILKNPIVRTVATAAAVFFTGGALTPLLGPTLSAAAGGFLGATGVGLLAGEKPKDALKQGLQVGVTAGVTAGIVNNAGPVLGSVGESFNQGMSNLGLDSLNPFTPAAGAGPVAAVSPAAVAPAAAAPAAAASPSLLSQAGSIAKDVLTYTGGAALLSGAMQPENPTPEDIGIEGVGGPTGQDLLNANPAEYAVTIGGTDTSYAQPDINTGMPFGTREDIQIGGGAGTSPTPQPGVVPEMPTNVATGPAPGYNIPTPDFSGSMPTQPSGGFTPPGTAQQPSIEELMDPNSPAYNPFAAQLAQMSGGEAPAVQAFAKGGIATVPVQKFASGGSAQQRARLEQQLAWAKKSNPRMAGALQSQLNRMTPSTPKALSANDRLQQQVALQKKAIERDAANQRTEERIAAQERARIEGEIQAARAMASQGKSIGTTDPKVLARIAADQKANPRLYMTEPQRVVYDAQVAQREQEARLLKEREEYDADQQRIAEMNAATIEANKIKEDLAKKAAEFEEYKKGVTVAPVEAAPDVTIGTPTAPATPTTPADIQVGTGGQPAAPTPDATSPAVPDIQIGSPGGIASIPVTADPPVYGPDGRQFANASEAISNGVFNYTTVPPVATAPAPAVPSVPTIENPFATAPITGTNPFAPGTGATAGDNPFGGNNTSQNTPAVGFAMGGIAAVAPSRFKSGSSSTGVTHFPRKVGAINGPGTGTSDSIPAMLSDGEFVFTAKAVRNAGGGSRREGAKRMYQMMKQLERKSNG